MAVFPDNFMADKSITRCVVIFRETFIPLALSVGVIFRENWPRLKLEILFLLLSFQQFVDKHAVHVQRKNLSMNLSK